MMCIKCRSFAINPNHHGREEGVDLDLCDVCYWRKRANGFTEEHNQEDSAGKEPCGLPGCQKFKEDRRNCIVCGYEED